MSIGFAYVWFYKGYINIRTCRFKDKNDYEYDYYDLI